MTDTKEQSDSSTPAPGWVDKPEPFHGWQFEVLPRMGQMVVVIWFDGEIRGQVELRSKAEVDKWEKAREMLNEKSQKNSLGK